METAAPAKRLPARHVVAVTIGNALEFYDFVTYSYFSVYIGRAFFPGEYSLLASLAAFGIGFLARPIGGIVIGRLADRRGRKPALVLSLLIMGVAVTGLALTPSYAAIGIAAPALVLLFRLVQGFALGGQVGAATAYLVEAAPAHRRGFYASLQLASQNVASLGARPGGGAQAGFMDEAMLAAWGWRIALLLGALIVPFGLWLRVTLPETHMRETPASPRAPGSAISLHPYARAILGTAVMLSAATIANYVIGYLPTYALDTLGLPAVAALTLPVVIGIGFLLSQTFSGWLSDHIGRRPLLIVPGALMQLAIWPGFYLVNAYPEPAVLYSATAVFVVLGGLCVAPMLTSLTETLPMAVRAGVVGTVYALAIAIFGGTTQFIVQWLIGVTGDPMAPAWYMGGAWLIGLIAMLLMKETAPVKIEAQVEAKVEAR